MLFVKLVFGRVVENILRVVKNQRREITGLRSDAQGILGEFGIVGFPNGDAQRKPPLADFINRNSCGGSNRLNIHSMRPFWWLNMFAASLFCTRYTGNGRLYSRLRCRDGRPLR